MKPELTLLVFAAILAFVQVLIAVLGALSQVGLPMLAGNRADMPGLTGWAGRAERGHRNMIVNLVLFSVLVLVAVVAGRTNAQTLLGAQIFVWARLAYAVIYLIGLPWLRTISWIVSVVGLAMIAGQLV